MKFTLICEHESGPKVTHEFESVFLPDTLDNIENFLKGCGFGLNGTLDIVSNDDLSINFDVNFDEDGRC